MKRFYSLLNTLMALNVVDDPKEQQIRADLVDEFKKLFEVHSAQNEELEALSKMIQKDNIRLRKQLEEKKEESAFYKATIAALPNPIFIKNEETQFLFFNQKYLEVFGILGKEGEFLGKQVLDLDYLSEEDRQMYQVQDSRLVKELASLHYEIPFVFADGGTHTGLYWCSGFEVAETHERGLVGEIVDISHQKNLETQLSTTIENLSIANEELNKARLTDFATGLGNRNALYLALPNIIAEAQEKNQPLCVLMADLDYFKTINDTYGHAMGDKVILAFANILTRTCDRNSDLTIRFGGEEFLIVLPYTSINKAQEIGLSICRTLRESSILPDRNMVSVSIGLSMFHNGEEFDATIQRADEALYRMKRSGKDGVFVLEHTQDA